MPFPKRNLCTQSNHEGSVEDESAFPMYTLDSQTRARNSRTEDSQDPTPAPTLSAKMKQRYTLKQWSFPSTVLENTGSVARDHLACERTWLAYIRTGVAIAGIGIGVHH